MKKNKTPAPPKPECGSIEQNKMLRVINDNGENPFPNSKACTEFWNSIAAEKERLPDSFFSLVEPDDYEDYLYDQIIG